MINFDAVDFSESYALKKWQVYFDAQYVCIYLFGYLLVYLSIYKIMYKSIYV